MTVRPVALSMFPEIVADKPVGPLPLSVQTGTNADLMWAIRDLYLTGSVLDVTYGRGGWWQRFTPDPFTKHDLYTLDGVDFRALPEADRSVDTVCFDPPYVPQGGTSDNNHGMANFRGRFGIERESWPAVDCLELSADGFVECARVARRFVLIKCMEFVSGGRFYDAPEMMRVRANDVGLKVHDVIVHNAGTGPGGHNIFEPTRCRRAHSYLLIFAIPA